MIVIFPCSSLLPLWLTNFSRHRKQIIIARMGPVSLQYYRFYGDTTSEREWMKWFRTITILVRRFLSAAWACGNTDALPLASASPRFSPSCLLCSVSQLWRRLIWAPLAEEERSRCCLINGGKKALRLAARERKRAVDGSPQKLLQVRLIT